MGNYVFHKWAEIGADDKAYPMCSTVYVSSDDAFAVALTLAWALGWDLGLALGFVFALGLGVFFDTTVGEELK